MEDERLMRCERCGSTVRISDIRYVLKADSSKMALCSACRGKPSAKESPTAPAAKKKSSKQEYLCTRCNYRFKFDPLGTVKLRCPYCSKEDKITKVMDKTEDAATKIKESDFFI